MLPSKNQIIAGLIICAGFMVVYNKVAPVRKALGGA
jgi:hypothetical protein